MSEIVCLGCGLPYREDARDASVCACGPANVEARTVACPTCGGSLRIGARACPYCRSTLATTRCGHCAAWNLALAQFCQACGGDLAGAAQATERGPTGPCPRCSRTLAPRLYGDLDVDECDGCGGLFVARAMVDRLVRSRDRCLALHLLLPKRTSEARRESGYLRCPSCRELMNRKVFGQCSGVVVDLCRDHGVWFDAGELSDVVAFLERGGWQKTQAREREEQSARDDTKMSLDTMHHVQPSEPGDLQWWTGFAVDLVRFFVD